MCYPGQECDDAVRTFQLDMLLFCSKALIIMGSILVCFALLGHPRFFLITVLLLSAGITFFEELTGRLINTVWILLYQILTLTMTLKMLWNWDILIGLTLWLTAVFFGGMILGYILQQMSSLEKSLAVISWYDLCRVIDLRLEYPKEILNRLYCLCFEPDEDTILDFH